MLREKRDKKTTPKGEENRRKRNQLIRSLREGKGTEPVLVKKEGGVRGQRGEKRHYREMRKHRGKGAPGEDRKKESYRFRKGKV